MKLWERNDATMEEVMNNKPSANWDRLPQKMTPHKEMWESLGFVFTDIGDDALYGAKLPEGWTAMQDIPSNFFYIFDGKGTERAIFYYQPAKKDAEMKMNNRFDIAFNVNQDVVFIDFIYKVYVWDSLYKRIVYDAGCGSETEFSELKAKARNWLNSNYPGWEDPTKYWN